jgi:hypothetical protein
MRLHGSITSFMATIVELIIMSYVALVPKDIMILMREYICSNELDDLVGYTVILTTDIEHVFSL